MVRNDVAPVQESHARLRQTLVGLALALPTLPSRLPAGVTFDPGGLDRRRLLAWIVGRSDDPELPALSPWGA